MAIVLTVNGVDRTSSVDWRTLEKLEVLTKEPDTLKFTIRNYSSKFTPALSDVVVLTDGGTKVFAGIVIETLDSTEGLSRDLVVQCKDYTHTLDRKLVSATYTGQTAAAIIASIFSTYVSGGFTTTNVVAAVTINKVVFNYVTVSAALTKLCEILGDYDWYVDYDQDLHFFKEGTVAAPFSLTDTSQNFIWGSLTLGQNVHQLRNHIIVRGGDVTGTLVTNTQQADGTARQFFVGYNLDSFTFKKNGSTQSVGSDGKDDPASYNVLYNPNRGLIIFPSAPAAGDDIYHEGYPIFPLIAEKTDVVSLALYGEFQYVIVDKTIKSRTAASQRCDAELKKWGSAVNEAKFITNTSGLKTGQTLTINLTGRGISKDFRIIRIAAKFRTPTTMQYEVQCLASEDVTMVDILNKLLVKNVADQIEIGLNEVVDRLYSAFENITITESTVVSISHNPQTETITLTEVEVAQPLNYATEFVLAPYDTPTIAYGGADVKRVFLLDGSPLG